MIKTFALSFIAKPLTLIRKRSFAQLSLHKNDLIEEIPVLTKTHANTRTVILNRPKQLNALNKPLVEMLLKYLKEWEKSEDVHLILLKGQGRALGAGADIKDISSMTQDPSRKPELEHLVDVFYEVLHCTGALNTPLVTIMNGITVGGACSLGVLARFNVATENTKVIMPETRFGHFCDVGSNFYLPRLSGNTGKYLALTAQTLHAEDVLTSGLATHFVPSNRLPCVEDSLLNLTRPSDDTIRRTIENFAIKPGEAPISEILHGKNRDIINNCFRFDTIAEILEALEKEGSVFSLNTIDQISQGSPISEVLTLEHLRRGSKLSLSECLYMEHNSWKVSPYEPDFYEGIISTMFTKKKPQWSRQSYLDVDLQKDIVAKYFRNETF